MDFVLLKCAVCSKELSCRAPTCVSCGDPDPFLFETRDAAANAEYHSRHKLERKVSHFQLNRFWYYVAPSIFVFVLVSVILMIWEITGCLRLLILLLALGVVGYATFLFSKLKKLYIEGLTLDHQEAKKKLSSLNDIAATKVACSIEAWREARNSRS